LRRQAEICEASKIIIDQLVMRGCHKTKKKKKKRGAFVSQSTQTKQMHFKLIKDNFYTKKNSKHIQGQVQA